MTNLQHPFCAPAVHPEGLSSTEAHSASTPLAAARLGEVRNARWDEIDRDGAVWTVPAERMKAAREHRMPLSLRALELLDGVAKLFDG